MVVSDDLMEVVASKAVGETGLLKMSLGSVILAKWIDRNWL